jgi:hypothetical protein
MNAEANRLRGSRGWADAAGVLALGAALAALVVSVLPVAAAHAQSGLGSASPCSTPRAAVVVQPPQVFGQLMSVWGHASGEPTGTFIGESKGRGQADLLATLTKWFRSREARALNSSSRDERGKTVVVYGKLLSARQRALSGGVVVFGFPGTDMTEDLRRFQRGDMPESEFLNRVAGFAVAGTDGTFQSTPLRRGQKYSTIAWATGYRVETSRLTVLPADPPRIDMVAFHLASLTGYLR